MVIENSEPDVQMNLDEKLWGPDNMEKTEPSLGDSNLVWYEDRYWDAMVIAVDTEKKVFEAMLLETEISIVNIHFCRFRPVG